MHAQHLILGIKGLELSSEEARLFAEIQPAGYILFSRNIQSPEQVRALTDQLRDLSKQEPFISIDNEGGRVWRTSAIGETPPSAQELTHHPDEQQRIQLIIQQAIATAHHLRLLGINYNLGPVLEISYDESLHNAMSGRCWGDNAQEVITHAGLVNRWLRKEGLLTSGKHFPNCSHGTSDPHHDLPVVPLTKDDLLRADLLPFTALAPELDSIMVAHTAFPFLDPEHPSRPASLSPPVVTELLRYQIGYEGLIVTDDLDMGAIVNTYGRGADVVAAIEAGNDLALICHQTDSVPQALNALKELPSYYLDDSLHRLENARRTIKPPLPFSSSVWDDNQKELQNVRAQVSSLSSLPASPVQDY